MAKLQSSTGNASADVTPDRVSIIFQKRNSVEQVHWPVRDWPDLKIYIDSKIKEENCQQPR